MQEGWVISSILVLGIGNILLRDEGVGVRVIEAMQGMTLPENVELADGGTSGAGLIDAIADRPRLIVVDAIQAEAEPGTVFRLSGEDLVPQDGAAISLHQLGLVDTLMMAKVLDCYPREVVVFGVQPGDVCPGLDLSAEVARAVPKVIEAIVSELRRSP